MSRHDQSSQESVQAGESADQQLAQQMPLTSFPIRLVDVLLYDLQIKRYPEQLGKSFEPGGAFNINLARPLIVEQRMEVAVILHARVPGEDAPAFSIDLTLNGVFEVSKDTDEQLIDTFVQNSVIPLLWPYARELMQNLTIRMRVLPILLPTLDLRPASQVSARQDQATNIPNIEQEANAE